MQLKEENWSSTRRKKLQNINETEIVKKIAGKERSKETREEDKQSTN